MNDIVEDRTGQRPERYAGKVTQVGNSKGVRLDAAFFAAVRSVRTGGVRREEMASREKALALLELVGISHYKDQYARNLGYGQQKLVEIARALATDAKLLLLDEPMAGLSTDMTLVMMDLIRNLQKNGKTIFFIEHNMKVVMDISDWIFVLSYGEEIARGTPPEVQRNDRVIEAYLGRH
jgi:branched-chain amino acid transport system ATP-binding protein